MHEFYCKTRGERKRWVRELRRLCVQCGFQAKYTLKGVLGEGSFSKVHLAVRSRDAVKFAVKAVKKELLFQQPTIMRCLVDEIKTLRLLNHPNIVKLHEIYETSSHVYLVMEHIEGEDLFTHLEKKKCYGEKDASVIVRQLLNILRYCHALDIIHRDVKPENIMIQLSPRSAKSTIKLIDFGLAEVINPFNSKRIVCGSPGYMAPELFGQTDYDAKVDMFSLGAVLYVM